MPRPPIQQHWVLRIKHLRANQPHLTATGIAKVLDAEAGQERKKERPAEWAMTPPHRTTVQHYVAGLDPEEVARSRFVHWPESFVSGQFPWEAAPGLLAEMKHRRATVRWATWWWQLRQSAPGAPLKELGAVATELAVEEIVAGTAGLSTAVTDQVERWLLRGDWKMPAIKDSASWSSITDAQRAELLGEFEDEMRHDPSDSEWTSEIVRRDSARGRPAH